MKRDEDKDLNAKAILVFIGIVLTYILVAVFTKSY